MIAETIAAPHPAEIVVRTPTPIAVRLLAETVAIPANAAATKAPEAATSAARQLATQLPPQLPQAAAMSAAPAEAKGLATPGLRIVAMTVARAKMPPRLRTVDLRSGPVTRPHAEDSGIGFQPVIS